MKVIRLVVRESVGLVLVGLGVGVTMALLAARPLASALYGVSPADPVTFLAVAGLMVGTALLASYLPVRRAVRVDPRWSPCAASRETVPGPARGGVERNRR